MCICAAVHLHLQPSGLKFSKHGIPEKDLPNLPDDLRNIWRGTNEPTTTETLEWVRDKVKPAQVTVFLQQDNRTTDNAVKVEVQARVTLPPGAQASRA